MPARVNLRAELAMGSCAFNPGRVLEITEWIADLPRRVPGLIELIWDDDEGVANRAADVLERIMREPSAAVRRAVMKYKDELIGYLSDAAFPKVRWNLALTVPRLELTVPECRRVAAMLETWLDDRMSIVKTTALHGMADLTLQDPGLKDGVVDLLRTAERSGTPAMRARSRILLKALESPAGKGRKRGSLHMFD